MSKRIFAFGPFQLLPTQRLLLEGGKPVPLGSRALDILIVLVGHAGEVVSGDRIIAAVWPTVAIELANVRVHIAALRKALGDGPAGNRFIVNIPGRGYSFVAPVEHRQEAPAAQAPAPAGPAPTRSLPVRLTPIIGRADIVGAISAQVPLCRLLTIAGPGGIGKTTVAIAVAEAVAGAYRDGATFVDLGLVGTPALLPSALAAALGLAIRSEDPVAGLAAALHAQQMLIVLDNCEHLVESTAALAEALLKGAPEVSILATSREPLRTEGEWVQRLAPLGVPPVSATLTAAEALTFPAVQLFVARAAAALGGLALADRDAAVVAEICRRLDGIALAIEFAAGRANTFTLEQLAALLDDRFRVLTRGRRTALPRQQTLRATLDWSYGLLSRPEQLTLSRLSVFNGAFTRAAACDVASGAGMTAGDVEDGVASLVGKSLVVTEAGGGLHYRLLETTRAYAREKLAENGESAVFARRHADYFRGVFARAEAEWATLPTAEWLASYARHIDNLRVALAWAFSAAGDASVGVALTVAAAPLWLELSLLDECLGWVERALSALDATPGQDERRRMQLHAAIAWPQMFATATRESAAAAWRAALGLAERLGDTDYVLRACWALWADRLNEGDFGVALTFAERFRARAAGSDDAADALVGERMVGASLHFLGDQSGARACTEHVLHRYLSPVNRSHIVRFQFDQRVTARMMLGRILWMQGFPDRALRELERMLEEAHAINHALTLCNALVQAGCPVALLAGDLGTAERYVALLRGHTAMRALGVWAPYADCFEGELLVRRGDVAQGLSLLRAGVKALRRAGFKQYRTASLLALAQCLVLGGKAAEAGAVIAEGLNRCDRTGERWCLAELQRMQGEILLAAAANGAPEAAEAAFVQALATAREQNALAWELRAALSLARLWRTRRRDDARVLLASVFDRFTERFQTEDLASAARMLGELGQSIPR